MTKFERTLRSLSFKSHYEMRVGRYLKLRFDNTCAVDYPEWAMSRGLVSEALGLTACGVGLTIYAPLIIPNGR